MLSRQVIALALLFFSGSAQVLAMPPTAKDNRVAIPISASERNQVLYEMREFLHNLFNLFNALAKKDMLTAASAVTPMAGLLDRLPGNVKDKLPEEFMQLTLAMNEAVRTMQRDARTRGDMSLTQSQMAELMGYCSGCHDTYRFEAAQAQR